MNSRLLAALVVGNTIMVALLISASKIDYRNPVRSAQEDQVEQLPGGGGASNSPLKHKLFAGYLKAFEVGEPEKWLYYWFVESESSEPAHDPIVLWLNGGPGGSSLVSATNRLSPFRLVDDDEFSSDGRFAWTEAANMLFIEGPVGVGFSYSSRPLNSSDDSTARANYLALKSFMRKFPKYAENPLYLTGVSYAGVYLPTLGVLVDRDPQLNLRGVAIENGCFDQSLQLSSRIVFARYHGLLAGADWKSITGECCYGREPSRENCVFSKLHLYRDCRNEVFRIGANLLKTYETIRYDLYSGQNALDKRSMPEEEEEDSSSRTREELSLANQFREPLCSGWDSPGLTSVLAGEQTRRALHVPAELNPGKKLWYCKQYPFRPGGLAPQMRQLIESERNLTMLVFNGNTDLVCNFIGSRWFVEGLGRTTLSGWHHWEFGGKVAGLVQHFDGITFATVHAAGHSAHLMKPRETLAMLKLFLASSSRNVHL